jgi:two-component system, NarL family, nitrate/nitrite response regulator NarL
MSQLGRLPVSSDIVRVLVADSTPLTGRLIADSLRRDRRLEITETSGAAVLATAARLKSDVTMLSAQLEGKQEKGFEVLKQLRVTVPHTRVIMLLDQDDRDSVVAAFRGGARGVFCRDHPPKMLIRCVHKVHEGHLWMNSNQLQFLIERLAVAPATRLINRKGAALLSKREQDVVRCIAEGLTNSEIARELRLGENTIKNYLFRIYNKLGISSRVELVLYATSQSASNKGNPQSLGSR